MAIFNIEEKKFTMSAVGQYALPASPEFYGTIAVYLKGNTPVGASVTAKARPACKQAMDDGDNVAFQAWYYETAAGAKAQTALTTDALITIPSPGMQVAISVDALTSGSFTVYWHPVLGLAL